MKILTVVAKVLLTCVLGLAFTIILEYISTSLLLAHMYPNQSLPDNDLGAGFAIVPLMVIVFIFGFPLSIDISWKLINTISDKLLAIRYPRLAE